MEDLSTGLERALLSSRLGHGLLFAVADASRVPPLVTRFVRTLLCSRRDSSPPPGGTAACGACPSCELFGSASKSSESRPLEEIPHPDLLVLKPASDTAYAVEQIRELCERFSLGRALGSERVACILEADRLSSGAGAAGHAFLKLLEEPRPYSRFLLLSSRLEGLSATLRSRVQVLRSPALSGPPASAAEPDSGADLKAWRELQNWLATGARPGASLRTPGDDDGFWKDRPTAVSTLKQLLSEAWRESRAQWSNDLEGDRRRLRALERLERLIVAIEGYGNGPLQWLAFRSDVSLRL